LESNGMCGRYVMPDDDAIGEYWAISCRIWLSTTMPRFNVAPTAQVPILVRNKAGALEPKAARWGLIPSWWQKEKPPALTFNARSEDAAQKPTWRESLRTRRCLMPARGWYEWNVNEPVRSKSGRKGGQPYFLFCPGAKVIAFAGIWSVWERPGCDPVVSCALLSTKAAPGIASIHSRMPVVLKPENQAAWLDPATTADGIQKLIADARQDVASYPVSTRVNNIRNDSPDLMEKVRTYTIDSLNLDAPEKP
jgi:putative SOS response-associated peptidase YedK